MSSYLPPHVLRSCHIACTRLFEYSYSPGNFPYLPHGTLRLRWLPARIPWSTLLLTATPHSHTYHLGDKVPWGRYGADLDHHDLFFLVRGVARGYASRSRESDMCTQCVISLPILDKLWVYCPRRHRPRPGSHIWVRVHASEEEGRITCLGSDNAGQGPVC